MKTILQNIFNDNQIEMLKGIKTNYDFRLKKGKRHFMRNLQYLLNKNKYKCGHKVFIVSIPKSGTYLLSEVLKNMGLIQSYLHLGSQKYVDYSEMKIMAERRLRPIKYGLPLRKSIQLLTAGEFAVGHVAWQERQWLRGLKILFLQRNIRHCLISLMNYLEYTKRNNKVIKLLAGERCPQKKLMLFLNQYGSEKMRQFHFMAGWVDEKGILKMDYDALNDHTLNQDIIKKIAVYLDMKMERPADNILDKSFSADTLTKSFGKAEPDDYWSDDAEAWFVKNGGIELNRKLGYKNAPPLIGAVGDSFA